LARRVEFVVEGGGARLVQALGLAVGQQARQAQTRRRVLLLELPIARTPGDIRVGGRVRWRPADPLGPALTPASALLITSSA